MNPQAEALKARTRKFALDVLAVLKTFQHTPEADIVRRQLARAATSVGANYRSTCRSRSHAEFVARIGVVLDEADESEFWLDVTQTAKLSTDPSIAVLWDESRQLMAIFSQSNRTARSRHAG